MKNREKVNKCTQVHRPIVFGYLFSPIQTDNVYDISLIPIEIHTVHKVFRDVASSYDLMNDAMSLGIHRVWKDKFMERLAPTHGTKLLDMAGGTGDIAFRYLKYIQNLPAGDCTRQSHVTVSDINENMLAVGKERAEHLNYTNESLRNCTVDWVCANAEQLPFADESFNAYTIAFGIRNCTHIDKVCKV